MRSIDNNNEATDCNKEPGIHPIVHKTKEISPIIPLSQKECMPIKNTCVSKTTLNTSSDAALMKQNISGERHNKEDIKENTPYECLSVETLKTSSEGAPIHTEDEKNSLEVIDQSVDKRRNILRALNQREKVKFMQIEFDVAKLGLPYREIDIIQFLVVSHWDLQDCLDRMKRLRKMYKEYKTDTVKLADALIRMRGMTELFSVGGFDPDGRRVFALHFGKIPAAKTLQEFPTFSKMLSMINDSLNVRLLDIKAGIAFVGDFKGYGSSNWSLKLFLKFMNMVQYNYPIRVRRIYLVNTPRFFWVIAKFVMAFTSKKFKERFRFLSLEDLCKVVPRTSLPPALGGTFMETKNIVDWIQKQLEQRYGRDWEIHYSQ